MKRITLVAVGAAVLMVSTTALAQPNTSSRNGTMVRASADSGWKLTKAWRADVDGKVSAGWLNLALMPKPLRR